VTIDNTPMPVTPAEIAAIRRRYLWMATSVFCIDLAITVISNAAQGSYSNLWRAAGIGALLLLGLNWLIARWLFEPIGRYLHGNLPFEAIERRLTRLPLLTARAVAALAFVVATIRFSMPWWHDPISILLEKPTIPDYITVCTVLTIFYFTYTYFVISDYLATLCNFVFTHYGRNLELFFGSYTLKLLVALLVISVAPLAATVVDLFSYDGDRQQEEILTDVAVAMLGVAISVYFISRSLLRPLGVLSRAMTKVGGGDLAVRVPVTSDDEIGRATGEFNSMVEGLSDRVYIRNMFGKYVSESVAVAILDDHARAGRVVDTTAEATVMFTDIQGFTRLSERLTPAETASILNTYLEVVVPSIQRHGGVVNSFIGDGLFASFNLPLPVKDHAAAALKAALDIQRQLNNAELPHKVHLPTRIGINTGMVVGVTIGAADRMTYTLLGDVVNVAARAEQLNKHYGTHILATESTVRKAGDGFVSRCLGATTLHGRDGDVVVYSVEGP
jgi:class 3 adenylate cyclase